MNNTFVKLLTIKSVNCKVFPTSEDIYNICEYIPDYEGLNMVYEGFSAWIDADMEHDRSVLITYTKLGYLDTKVSEEHDRALC